MRRENDKNKNLKVVAIGLALIVMIVGIYFFKSYRENKSNQEAQDASISAPSDSTTKNNVQTISPKDLLGEMNGDKKVTVIDIRSADEFSSEHLLNSINMPSDTFNDSFSTLNAAYTYVLVDDTNSQELLDLAGTFLPSKGFKNVSYLDGGFTEWKNEFYSTVSIGNPNSLVDQSKVRYVNSDQLKNLLASETDFFIIDVRGKNSYDAEHIPKAINIYVDDIEKRINEIPLGKKIVVYDDNTISAFQAAVRLFDLGHANTLTLSDGFPVWKSKNYPTEKTQP